MREELKFILGHINEWLKFAESKGTATVVVNVACALGILQLIKAATEANQALVYYAYAVIGMLLLSTAICLTSFIPQLLMPWFVGRGTPKATDNLLFFGHVAKYPPKPYLAKLYMHLDQSEPESFPEIELHYAEEIVTNARITLRKYRAFSLAAWLSIIAIATPPVALLLYVADRCCKHQAPDS